MVIDYTDAFNAVKGLTNPEVARKLGLFNMRISVDTKNQIQVSPDAILGLEELSQSLVSGHDSLVAAPPGSSLSPVQSTSHSYTGLPLCETQVGIHYLAASVGNLIPTYGYCGVIMQDSVLTYPYSLYDALFNTFGRTDAITVVALQQGTLFNGADSKPLIAGMTLRKGDVRLSVTLRKLMVKL